MAPGPTGPIRVPDIKVDISEDGGKTWSLPWVLWARRITQGVNTASGATGGGSGGPTGPTGPAGGEGEISPASILASVSLRF